jgi:hypothetical protein
MANRRAVVSGVVATAALGAGGYWLARPSYPDAVARVWNTYDPGDLPETAYLIHHAALAANSHNAQAWRFRPQAGGIDLLPDLDRATPVVDPDRTAAAGNRQRCRANKPGEAGMRGTARQYDRFDPPMRLFFMASRMKGLPVQVLHDYSGETATMRVRLARLFSVVDAWGADLSRTETVTLLNDLDFFAPSWLAVPRLIWREIDNDSVGVTFTNGSHRVSAVLEFNDAGEVVNFISDDRGAMQDDGSLKVVRWSTPMRSYKDFDGRRYPIEGEAIWHYPQGDFTYGRFLLKAVTAE